MDILIVYDSIYGNTENIARTLVSTLTGAARVMVARAGEAEVSGLKAGDLLIVGSPVQGGRPLPTVKAFLGRIPARALEGVRVAAFDTRMTMWIARLFGWAADRILAALKAKGGQEASPPQGFIVTGRAGPLKEGEPERAAEWARGLVR